MSKISVKSPPKLDLAGILPVKLVFSPRFSNGWLNMAFSTGDFKDDEGKKIGTIRLNCDCSVDIRVGEDMYSIEPRALFDFVRKGIDPIAVEMAIKEVEGEPEK